MAPSQDIGHPDLRIDFCKLIQNVPAGAAVHDATAAVIAANHAAAELLGDEPEDLMGHLVTGQQWRFLCDDIGDRLLRQVGRRLSHVIREDETVARLGRDELVVLLTDLGEELNAAAMTVESAGERILETLSAPYDLGIDISNHGTARIGIAFFKNSTESVETLFKQADLAMYQAKAMGRNTLHFFNVAMQVAVDERVALEFDLRNAPRRDELVLPLQPQIALGGRTVGAEALVRWNHPTRGMLYPASFIPLAEASGLILPLGAWVLQAACTQLVRWSTDPLLFHLTVSINVSAHQLREGRFVEFVSNVIASSGASPLLLKLELTESVLAEDIEAVIGKMNALKSRGVLFALDDFGIGYSFLSCLKRLPLYQLKIDRSFGKCSAARRTRRSSASSFGSARRWLWRSLQRASRTSRSINS